MAYIVKNITNKLDKRHPFANTLVEFIYDKKNFTTDVVQISVGNEVIIDGELPISVHNLRIKGFITIKKISENELHTFLKESIDNVQEVINLETNNPGINIPEPEINKEEDELQSKILKKKKS